MDIFIRNTFYKGPVQSVVLDWAGTAVDHGCMGPAAVFVDVFAEKEITVSVKEARQFMGLAKIDHIRGMCDLPTVIRQWEFVYNRKPEESDIQSLYDRTANLMVKTMQTNSDPIDNVIDAVNELRSMRVKIGSCTGYVQEMMDVLVPAAREKGYSPDAVVCSSDVHSGRPFPWMCYQNAILLETYPMEAMVKIGDTVADIQEGLNAGMWTIGITRTGNEIGLSKSDVEAVDPSELKQRIIDVEKEFKQAGAHYVLESAADVVPVIQSINQRLADGETPLGR